MAIIDVRGLVDDGSSDLTIAGKLSVVGVITSSAGSLGELSVASNYLAGQNLGAPNSWVIVNQWLTSSITTPGITAISTGSMTVNTPGFYNITAAMSFSGSAGKYTFASFVNGSLNSDSQLQDTIAAGQPYPVALTISDLDSFNAGDVIDIRVQCTNAGANFQLNYGNFSMFRVFG